jgi:RimJ/RimL family protein N-acetyltransferase
MRILEKCGFLRKAVHRNAITKHGVVMDEVLYVRFRDDPAQ